MTKLELVRLIGDVLTEIDVARGSINPELPSRKKLDDLRRKLDSLQFEITKHIFKEEQIC